MDYFVNVIEGRTSVRSFKKDRLAPGLWDKLLGAAMAAPSAVNCQPWEFIVIEDRKTLEDLARALPYAKMAAGAGGALVACGRPSRAFEGKTEFAIIDTSLACENFLLAAHALGLGAVWTALYPEEDRQAAVRGILGIPEDIIPLALIPVGMPAEVQKPKQKYNPDFVHTGKW